jgi:hypothetical protein
MPLPQALINFGNCPATGQYGFKLVLTTANGNSYPTDWYNINSATPEQVRDLVYNDLRNAGWTVEKSGTTGLIVKSYLDPALLRSSVIKKVEVIDIGLGKNQRPTVSGSGGVQASQANPWKIRFEATATVTTMPQDVTCQMTIDGDVVSADLTAGMSPSAVASALRDALDNNLVDVTLSGDTVSFTSKNGLTVANVELAFTGTDEGPADWLGFELTIPAEDTP